MVAHLGLLLQQYMLTRFFRNFSDRVALKQWQNKQVQKFIQHIVPQSPFYQQLYQGYALHEWVKLPYIDKALMMEHFSQLNTRQIRKENAFEVALQAEESRDFSAKIGDVSVGLSSGTSGNRGLFLVSDREQARWAGAMLAKTLPDPLWVTQRIALFLRANSNLYTSIDKGRIHFRFFDMVTPIEEHLYPLEEYQPSILIAPPSYLRFLAEEVLQNGRQLRPNKIISVAEVLDPLDEELIKTAFQQPVHQIYQCTEGFLACTCPYGTLHLNEDLIHIEKEYLSVEDGKFSPIITDFSRVTQPILRYRLNDILTEQFSPCPCGSPLQAISQIEGRSDDILPFPALDNRRYVMIFPDFIRRALITSSPDIQEYLVVQHSPSQLVISLRTHSGTSDQTSRAVVQTIRKLCKEQNCHAPDVLFTPYTYKPSTTKLRRVKRIFPLPDRYQEVSDEI